MEYRGDADVHIEDKTMISLDANLSSHGFSIIRFSLDKWDIHILVNSWDCTKHQKIYKMFIHLLDIKDKYE